MKYCFSAILACLTLTSASNAQNKTDSKNLEKTLDEVVVLNERIQIPLKKQNRTIQIITQAEIAKLPVRSINELLSYVSGVDVRQRGPNGSQADIGIDGGTFDQTLVLINGFKMSDVQTGHNMMNLPIPLAAIERIEVLKGAASMVYGVNAMMGVINIVTKKDPESNVFLQTNGGSSFQNNDSTGNTFANFGAQVVAQYSTENWHHLLAASLDKGNGYRYNTAYDNSKLFYAVEGKISRIVSLEAFAGANYNTFGANNFYSAPGDKEAKETVNTVNAGFRLPIQINKNWLLKPALNYRNGYDHYIYTRKNPSVYENKHHTNTFDASLDNTFNSRIGTWAMGLNVRPEAISSNNLGERSRMNYGAFLAYQNSFENKFDLNIGLYFNQNSIFGKRLYPGIDLGYQVSTSTRLYANAGLGQRLPTFTDLYYNSPTNKGNDLLRPEEMRSYELGVKYAKNQIKLQSSLFYKNGTSFIDWVRPDTLSPWSAHNFTTLNIAGFNLNGSFWHKFGAMNLLVNSSYTFLSPKIGTPMESSIQNWNSQYAINSLQHQWVLSASLQVNKHWEFTASNRYVKRLNAGNPIGEYARNSFSLTDAKIRYTQGSFGVWVSMNNILDVKHIESGVVPLPGRWSTVGLSWQLK